MDKIKSEELFQEFVKQQGWENANNLATLELFFKSALEKGYNLGVTAGKLEALEYSEKEKENYLNHLSYNEGFEDGYNRGISKR